MNERQFNDMVRDWWFTRTGTWWGNWHDVERDKCSMAECVDPLGWVP